MKSKLEDIIASHRLNALRDSRPLDELIDRACETPPPLDFIGALSVPGPAVIAEIKRRSPSKGDLALDLDPGEVAGMYASGGAQCLSVLTDTEFFGGSEQDLRNAKKSAGIPTLRKDFTVCQKDVCDARLMGADAILLIVAALSESELKALYTLARDLGLAVLVEVHDFYELDRALDIEPLMIGVNQRDLATFELDHERAIKMAGSLPAGTVSVAESGIRDGEDARELFEAGFDAILVGETLVRASDRKKAVEELLGRY